MNISKEMLYVLMGTGFTFLATAIGASLVFFFKDNMKTSSQKLFLGFAAGVMIAASVWSLLIPAINIVNDRHQSVPLIVGGGFILGALFLMLLDSLIPHLHFVSNETEGIKSSFKRTTLLTFAVTLHNIPEGMAVGIAFVMAVQTPETTPLMGAIALAIGMALQNVPEGAAISLPLKKEGFSNGKAFLYGAGSGFVEPLGGILTVLLAGFITGLMPWILAFAAGAMIYVVVEELIPESNLGEHSNAGTISVMFGFLLMMMLDVMLG